MASCSTLMRARPPGDGARPLALYHAAWRPFFRAIATDDRGRTRARHAHWTDRFTSRHRATSRRDARYVDASRLNPVSFALGPSRAEAPGYIGVGWLDRCEDADRR